MSSHRKQPDWHLMTRDEVDGHAAALWAAGDAWMAAFGAKRVDPVAKAEFQRCMQLMVEALK